MSRRDEYGFAAARGLVAGLRSLGVAEPPANLATRTLSAVGLADQYVTIPSPLGQLYLAFNERGISAVRHARQAAEFERDFGARFGRRLAPAHALPAWLVNGMERALRGEGSTGLRFDLRGVSEFERAVLLKALEIPRGEVRPYSWIAREIGRPKAVRAVGTALAHNPIPFFIPCHRVVRSDGHLGRYSLVSDDAKRIMLAAEGLDPDALEALAGQGVRYFGSDTTRIFCFPTCRHAQRTMERHLRRFHSEAEALAAGYRPCKVCRPRKEA
ncbi:MAG TPA: methylated-DNA--[protein]-cysteine S-methyltransferase [Ktedonobacterales bacterium]